MCYEGGPSPLDRVFGPVERLIYRVMRVDPEREQRWNVYALSMIAFSAVGLVLLFLLQRFQSDLPFNPTQVGNVRADAGVRDLDQLRHQHQLAELRR